MNLIFVIAVSLLLLLGLMPEAFVNAADAQRYTTRYDNVDLDQILRSDRLLKNYVNCLLDKGKCSPDGAELKRLLPDALRSACDKCSERQRNASRKIIRHLIENKRDWWNSLEAKYDPQQSYRKRYQAEIQQEDIKL